MNWRRVKMWAVAALLAVPSCRFDTSGVSRSLDAQNADSARDHLADTPKDSSDGMTPDAGKDTFEADTDMALDLATDAIPDAMDCPEECSSCAGGVCEMDCNNDGDCSCPPGVPCKIDCTSDNCSNDIDCSQATACEVSCSGSSCGGDITCGSGPCKINCTGDSCDGNIDCGQSCACDVTCHGDACDGDLRCPDGCSSGESSCSSSLPGCNTC